MPQVLLNECVHRIVWNCDDSTPHFVNLTTATVQKQSYTNCCYHWLCRIKLTSRCHLLGLYRVVGDHWRIV